MFNYRAQIILAKHNTRVDQQGMNAKKAVLKKIYERGQPALYRSQFEISSYIWGCRPTPLQHCK